jgi:succinate-semialdehyde dehydrogenase/glutarate-semialdehyde dehydrogenase
VENRKGADVQLVQTVNPATGKVLREYAIDPANEVERKISVAHAAFTKWRYSSFTERATLLKEVARLLRDHAEKYSQLMAEEMGKPVREGSAEITKCAWVCEHYAEHAEEYLRDEPVATDAQRSFISYRPHGVLLAIMPWNYPFWQVFRFAAPALMAGNTGILKHAANVTGCSMAIQSLFQDAGAPEGVFQSIVVPGNAMEHVVANPHIRSISLTGSTPAGRSVAAMAGQHLKKTVLELGGSDPFIVLDDADLDLAASLGVKARMLCSGQSCIAAKRFIVVETVHNDFVHRFTENMRRIRIGDPVDPSTDAGPLARADLREELNRQVTDSIERGAKLILGGHVPEGAGYFYPPTILTDVLPGTPAFDEELFGPVAAIVRAHDEEHAIDLANATNFGLGAAVFTRDAERGERIAATELDAGACFVNSIVKSDPRLPFGGIKDSGYGRELGRQGILELVNIKSVYVG